MYELFYFLSIYTRVTDEFSRQQLGLTQKKKDKQYPDIFAEQLDIKNAESPQWLETCDKSELDAYKKNLHKLHRIYTKRCSLCERIRQSMRRYAFFGKSKELSKQALLCDYETI